MEEKTAHSLIQSYFLNAYYAPGTSSSPGDKAMKMTNKSHCPMRLTVQMQRREKEMPIVQ